MNKLLFEGKVGIVTGATSGIGETTARLLASEGAKLVLAGRRTEKGEAVAESIRAAGGEASFFTCDVKCEEQVKAMVDFAVNKYGKLDFAFNNAGVASGQYELKLLHETSTELCREIFDINVMGLYFCMKYELPELLKAGGGAIVNNVSNAAVRSDVLSFAYGVSKNAAFGATKNAAMDYADKNIRINGIAPGMTDTPMIGAWKEAAPEGYAAMEASIPDKHAATTTEQANAVMYLLSEYSSHIIGQMIVIDGGQTVKL